ncbi:hypothetical protein BC628DRAFT_1092723 [Trametes gibbosa]|nr:hypothetical protein BC628DRAFT_1092723 [Trametes gibbosa]
MFHEDCLWRALPKLPVANWGTECVNLECTYHWLNFAERVVCPYASSSRSAQQRRICFFMILFHHVILWHSHNRTCLVLLYGSYSTLNYLRGEAAERIILDVPPERHRQRGLEDQLVMVSSQRLKSFSFFAGSTPASDNRHLDDETNHSAGPSTD